MEKDNCILCGVETEYTKNTHIDYRYGYIEGAGQLCKVCFNNANDREMVCVPKNYFIDYSNNYDLGEKLRAYFHQSYTKNNRE